MSEIIEKPNQLDKTETINICSDYDLGCREDEKTDIKICERCFYGIGFEDCDSWNGADGYCPILRLTPNK